MQKTTISPIWAAAAALVLTRDALVAYLAGDFASIDDASHEAIDREVENLTREIVEA